MATFLCRIKNIKVKDLNQVDSRIICAGNPDWLRTASEFRQSLKSNTDKNLLTISHGDKCELTSGGYKLIDVPIVADTNLILFSNTSDQPRNYIPYQIEFFDTNQERITSIKIETINVRNMFTIIPPIGAKSLDYCINDEYWKRHYYDFSFECVICNPLSDSE